MNFFSFSSLTFRLASVVLVSAALFIGYEFLRVPPEFPEGKNFVVNENESLLSISLRLKEFGYITSPLLFRSAISFLNKEKDIQLGGYVFTTPMSLVGMVSTFVHGKPNLPLLSVTIPEGSTSFEVASFVAKAMPSISVDVFGEMISKHTADGKLFPSTYFLLPSYKEEDIVKLMLSTYTKKTKKLFEDNAITAPLKSENDVITLASILEGEAKTEIDMKIVAGILLARLSLGMPLQVDVAKETYKQKGLPFMPINNPGLVALSAALSPTKTEYLYYITGNDGKMYYAKTFIEHRRNIIKHLK